MIGIVGLAVLYSRLNVFACIKDDFEGRIIDGEDAKIRNYPHAVFLEVMRTKDTTHICGASIVNQHFLLTAAHCFSVEYKGVKDTIVAFAGHENLSKANIVRSTESPLLHEKYDTDLVKNDIALIYLPHALPLGKVVKRIILMRSFPRNVKGAIAGWGIINEITNEETILLKAITQTIKDKEDCSQLISGPGMMCAGSTRSSDPRPAQGDSGSGLITDNYQLIGLLSYKMTSMPALPVYTNVSYYYDWIQFHIQNKCSKI